MSQKAEENNNEGFVLGGYSGGKGTDDFTAIGRSGYDDTMIERIRDPEGGKKTEMPTAVPSPFARFDLVQTAFKNIKATKRLTAEKGVASKFDERLVSHTLDLAECVFDSLARGDKLEILTWNKKTHLQELTNSVSKEHKDYAESLNLYLSQDAETYNFVKMERIFLFKYGTTVIGSTSPVTLFCPSAADLSKKLGIRRMTKDGDLYFGESSLPLYERTLDFQKWFYYLIDICKEELQKNKGVWEKLKYIDEYATKSREIVNENKSDAAFFESKPDFRNEYVPLNTKGENTPVDILGVELYVEKPDAIDKSLQEKSDFVIKTTKKDYVETPLLPLVLQPGFAKPDWAYLRKFFWQPSIAVVESKVDTPWRERREIPGFSDIKEYYLTVSDFLEPYLVRMIYPISEHFYYGGCKADKNSNGYLLPLNVDFFRFFSVEDLIAGETDAQKPRLSIIPQNNGDVKVTLRIPVRRGDITFDRIYKNCDQNQMPDEKSPEGGVIVEAKIGTTIFPFVKVDDNTDVNIQYRVQLVDSDAALQQRTYKLEFYSQNAVPQILLGDKNPKHRFDKTMSSGKYDSTTDYYKVNKEFDIIQLKINSPSAKALVIPNWRKYKGTDTKFTFAVDFGTTNTYVAYRKDDDGPYPFNLSDAIATLYENGEKTELNIRGVGGEDIIDAINREFVPRKIGTKENEKNDNIFQFPQRTAIAYSEEITDDDWTDGDGLEPLHEGNIPFGYEKTTQFGNVIATDLKWSDNDDRVEKQRNAYLEELVMLMQAKVLSENGNLKKTRIIWFYPSSMSRPDKKELAAKWTSYFLNYFFIHDKEIKEPPEGCLVSVRESLAPFYAEIDNSNAFHDDTVVSIDIGGGTTDVAVFQDAELKVMTSFKFAGNALFGDGYAKQAADKNGFVLKFADKFASKLESYRKPSDILKSLRDPKKAKASDINAFLFSVENAIDFWAEGKDISRMTRADLSYTNELEKCHDLKFLILYFYVALIYHISKILKTENLMKNGKPVAVKYLMFSGTASKILNILGSVENIKDFTQKVFKDLGLEHEKLDKVILVKKPKEVTCNGGLGPYIKKMENASEESHRNADSIIYTCIKDKEYDKSIKYSSYLDDDGLIDIKAELVDFHQFFFALDKDKYYNFEDFFVINKSVTKLAEDNYEKLIDKWLKDSIIRNQPLDKKSQKPVDAEVSETPFFMPLKSIILELSEKIAKMGK